jgi:hypothetical protein
MSGCLHVLYCRKEKFRYPSIRVPKPRASLDILEKTIPAPLTEMEPTILGLQTRSLVTARTLLLNFLGFLVENMEIIWLRNGGDSIFRPATNSQALPVYPPTEAS